MPKAELGRLLPSVQPVVDTVCSYLDPPPETPRLSLGRWTPDVEQRLGPALKQVSAVLKSDLRASWTQLGPEVFPRPWNAFQRWIDQLATTSEAFELRALTVPISEAMWLLLREDALLHGLRANDRGSTSMLSQIPAQILQTAKQSGNLQLAERFFQRMLSHEVAPGVRPYSWFYDTGDIRRVGGLPWPGLRPLTWPEPASVLPPGVAAEMQRLYPEIAMQARTMRTVLSQQDDAYPEIAQKKQWTKLVLYSATGGWDPQLCASFSIVCELLRGKMKSENPLVRSMYEQEMLPPTDEAVILFRVAAGGAAHLHDGQDARINVHLCLLDCNASEIVVAGDARPYTDGSLFAFEDRADHEIINRGELDRLLLTIGVFHPDYDPTEEEFSSPQQVLRLIVQHYAEGEQQSLPSSIVEPALVLASFYGYAPVVQILLEHNKDLAAVAQDSGGTSAVQAAIQGVSRPGAAAALRIDNAKQVLGLLNAHGAKMHFDGKVQSNLRVALKQVTSSLKDDGVAQMQLLAHIEELGKVGQRGSARGRKHARKSQGPRRMSSHDL